jgi:hypothetical protein
MDSEQKYTEAVERYHLLTPFEIDEYCLEKLSEYPRGLAIKILELISSNAKNIPVKEFWTQLIGGVIKGEHPFFFEIEVLKNPDEKPLVLDVDEIELDEYLDYINDKNILK